MEIRKALISKLFDSAYMQRWNDKFRPMDLYELDKQAHKMVIAYFIGKFDEAKKDFSWVEVIEGGLFEFLQRVVLTDIKPPVFYMIKGNFKSYQKLNKWVYQELEPIISPLGDEFKDKFVSYLNSSNMTQSKRILAAAHFSATLWEFQLLRQANPTGYEMDQIQNRLKDSKEQYSDLEGIKQLGSHPKYNDFISLCGELRFQTRWSNLHRIPRTSVIGHSLLVAILAYLFSWQLNACNQRRINNYFTGLFHDFPEVLTRDIVSPVKGSVRGLSKLLKNIEKDLMEKEVYSLIPSEWRSQFELFTENEFADVVLLNNKWQKVSANDICDKYNNDRYSARDGTLIKAVDDLIAFVEAHEAIKNGCAHDEFVEAKAELKAKYKNFQVGNLDIGRIYADFD